MDSHDNPFLDFILIAFAFLTLILAFFGGFRMFTDKVREHTVYIENGIKTKEIYSYENQTIDLDNLK